MPEGPKRGVVAAFGKMYENPLLQFADWVFRGISQVVLQNNPISGIVILAGLLYGSWTLGVAALLGSAVATLAAMVLKADRPSIAAGLYGFNGALVGIAIDWYTGVALSPYQVMAWEILLYIIFGAALSTVLAGTLSRFFHHVQIPPLTMPFVLCAWIFVGGTHFSPTLDLHHIGAGGGELVSQATDYSWNTWFHGIGKGTSEIFLEDSAVTGYAILLGILINSRISFIMSIVAAALSLGTAMVLGIDPKQLDLGMFSFNAILTGIALGGLFYVLTWQGFLYSLFGIVISTWLYAALGGILTPLHLPVFTSSFILTTWAFMMAKDCFSSLVPVPITEATKPEDHLKRYLAGGFSEE
jgi:urea transporter